jgi:outer membrane protein assembly factor BamB
MRGLVTSVAARALLLAACSFGAAAETTDPTRQWPSWRGPLANGVSPHGNPPVEWSETRNVRWKVELPGPGHASPIVWGDRVYVLAAVPTDRQVETAGSEGGAAPETEPRTGGPPRNPSPVHVHRFVVIALDRDSGSTVWQTVVREEVPHERGHVTASQASASPVTDGAHIWAFFGSRGLYCLDLRGKVVWEKDLGDMRTRNEFGEGASPVLHGDTLVVNWDHEGDSFIAALDKRTGEERWRAARDEPTSWATPLVVEDEAGARVVVSGSNRVRAYDLESGDVIWECGGLGLNCVPVPVADSETVFVMSGWREKAGMAIRYRGAKGDLTDGEAVAWRLDEGLSYVPSPLLYDGKLYMLERYSNLLSCHDLRTGKAQYTKRRVEGLTNVYASPVGAAGRIYILGRDGRAAVVRHGTRFELLARNELDDAFDASPAIVGDVLYLRGREHLYAIGNTETAPEPHEK